MIGNRALGVSAIAVGIALALGSTAAVATGTPGATQLPGKGTVSAGTVNVGAISSGGQNIDIGGNAVINWGTGTGINAGQPGGFNIGSSAGLTFSGSGGSAVLNIDSSGNSSQILGGLSANGPDVFVANQNGVIVGASARVFGSGSVSFIANVLRPTAAADFATSPANLAYGGTGGDIVVQQGATISNSVLLSGAGVVNVDLGTFTGGAATLMVGLPSANAGAFGTSNIASALNVSGQLAGGSLAGFNSAGSASNIGILDLRHMPGYNVAGVFTNNGTLTLPQTNGAVHNASQLYTYVGGYFTALVNDGNYASRGTVGVTGGNLVNNGTITGTGGSSPYASVTVTDGSITNTGTLTGFNEIETLSDANYTAKADYSIINSGTISTTQQVLGINADTAGIPNDDVIGNAVNTGVLQVSASNAYSSLQLAARNDTTLRGVINVGSQAASESNPLAAFGLFADKGTATLGTPVPFSETAQISGGYSAKVMANLKGSGWAEVDGGDKLANDYAIRIGAGAIVDAPKVYFGGSYLTAYPNIILQGTVQGDQIFFGNCYIECGLGTQSRAVSDVFAGPKGIIISPSVEFDFTGALKIAPYLNDDNFRYNYLPISAPDGVALKLNPVAYQTNGTANGHSAVNILVDGAVTLVPFLSPYDASPAIYGAGIAYGPTSIPNTHLVVQATGNIETESSLMGGNFYWPGYVYLGTIGYTPDGSVAPGTLGAGTISLGGDFSNVLPGSVDGAGGVHFITQNPLALNGYSITTNANSWVNFGTDELTRGYASGSLGGAFFGGVPGTGTIVNYGALDPSFFHTHAPVASR